MTEPISNDVLEIRDDDEVVQFLNSFLSEEEEDRLLEKGETPIPPFRRGGGYIDVSSHWFFGNIFCDSGMVV